MIRISLPRPLRLDTCPRKARIDKCSDPSWWYASRVGQVVDIEMIDAEGFWSREGGIYNCINKIKPEDATLLPLQN